MKKKMQLIWNLEHNLKCKQQIKPADQQSFIDVFILIAGSKASINEIGFQKPVEGGTV